MPKRKLCCERGPWSVTLTTFWLIHSIKTIHKKSIYTRFLGTVEFVEVFGSDSDKDNNSDSDEDEESMKLEVFITGEWFTKDERNAVTGTPTTSIVVEPSKVIYGPSTNNAQEWASLGPIKLLDLLYLSEDIMIARNNVNMDSLFVWQRVQSS